MRIGYWLAKGDGEFLVFMSESFVGQIKSFKIPRYFEECTKICQVVKKVGIPATHMNWNNISFVFD